jgi:hypothetical protein
MLRARSFLIDGEAVACDGNGLPVFDRLRYRRQDGRVSCIQAPSRMPSTRSTPLGRAITCSLHTCWPARDGLADVTAIHIVRMIKTIGAITVVIPRNFAILFIGGANARLPGFTISWSLCPRCAF